MHEDAKRSMPSSAETASQSVSLRDEAAQARRQQPRIPDYTSNALPARTESLRLDAEGNMLRTLQALLDRAALSAATLFKASSPSAPWAAAPLPP